VEGIWTVTVGIKEYEAESRRHAVDFNAKDGTEDIDLSLKMVGGTDGSRDSLDRGFVYRSWLTNKLDESSSVLVNMRIDDVLRTTNPTGKPLDRDNQHPQ
jgi:hypothetical protein